MQLQHGRSTLKDDSCSKDIAAIVPPDSWQTEDEEDIQLYREVRDEFKMYVCMYVGDEAAIVSYICA